MKNENTPAAYKVVADKIIGIMETSGELPWRKPWKGGTAACGMNKISGKHYRGINAFITALVQCTSGYSTNEWVTFKQAQSLGGAVKKGEKATPVFFFQFIEKEKNGKKERIPLARYYSVFNLDQCEGIEKKEIAEVSATTAERIESAEKLFSSLKHLPEIVHQEQKAYYQPSTDMINMPVFDSFNSGAEYYSTLFHEVVHATGHEKRLNRKTLTSVAAFGDHDYSKEELVAEFGACFLSNDCGILADTEQNSAAYLQGWLKALKSNPKWLVEAANQAQKAVAYLKGETNTEGKENEGNDQG